MQIRRSKDIPVFAKKKIKNTTRRFTMNCAPCVICGLDLMPEVGVVWYEPTKPMFVVEDESMCYVRFHVMDGMHAVCFDAHRSSLCMTVVESINPVTRDHIYDRHMHTIRIRTVAKKATESWDEYLQRCDNPSRGYELCRARILLAITNIGKNKTGLNADMTK